jgi:hypothetical protein
MKYIKNTLITSISFMFGVFLVYLLFWNHVDYNEIGIAYNSRTGELNKQDVGWHFTPPWVKVTYIPTIPIRVEFDQYSKFVLPKLVKFNPEHYKDFVNIEGFRYYGEIKWVFRQYAYSGRQWSFLEEVK